MMPIQKTIIVVDDERDIRELLSLVLESAGYTVVAVAHAQEVLDILATRQVALLITDYHMPEMNGATLIANVHTSHTRLPIILASCQEGIASLAASCGANGYFQKAMPIAHLLELVTAMLRNDGEKSGDHIAAHQGQ